MSKRVRALQLVLNCHVRPDLGMMIMLRSAPTAMRQHVALHSVRNCTPQLAASVRLRTAWYMEPRLWNQCVAESDSASMHAIGQMAMARRTYASCCHHTYMYKWSPGFVHPFYFKPEHKVCYMPLTAAVTTGTTHVQLLSALQMRHTCMGR
jgi:hypothetical protein